MLHGKEQFLLHDKKTNVKKSKLNMGKKRGGKAVIHAHIPAGICKIRTWVPILLL